MNVLQGGVVSTLSNPQAGGPPLVSCPRLLIQFICSYPPCRRLFLCPQHEDAPCRGDRDPLHSHIYIKFIYVFIYLYLCNVWCSVCKIDTSHRGFWWLGQHLSCFISVCIHYCLHHHASGFLILILCL